MTHDTSEEVAPDAEMVLYQRFMEELKVRLSAIRGMLDEMATITGSPHAFIVAESCYLQARYVCELIALASLAINTTSDASNKLLGSYRPKETFDALRKLNVNAFPKAIDLHDKEGAFHFEFAPAKDMTPDQLYDIYWACGDALHRGTLKNILSGKVRPFNIGDLRNWMLQLANFLNQHTILLDGHEEVFVVDLSGGQDSAALVQRGSLKA